MSPLASFDRVPSQKSHAYETFPDPVTELIKSILPPRFAVRLLARRLTDGTRTPLIVPFPKFPFPVFPFVREIVVVGELTIARVFGSRISSFMNQFPTQRVVLEKLAPLPVTLFPEILSTAVQSYPYIPTSPPVTGTRFTFSLARKLLPDILFPLASVIPMAPRRLFPEFFVLH